MTAMNQVDTNDILNRLLALHHRSLPKYLSFAPPWQLRQHKKAAAVLDQIVADHRRTVDRLASMILENGGTIRHGEFPMSFTALHDLSLDYLVSRMIERQKRFIPVIESLANQLNLAPFAQAVAREAVGEARGHLENLEELADEVAQKAA